MDTTRRPEPLISPTHVAPATSAASVAPSTSRLVGIDVARSLALFGMIVAHVGAVPSVIDWGQPGTWMGIVDGRSSTLFAILAGVSIAIVTGRSTPVAGAALGRARVRLTIRAVVLIAVGFLLMALGTPVAVILPTYGVLFLLSLPVLRWRRRWLLAVAGLTVALSIPVATVAAEVYFNTSEYTNQLGLIYPPVTFLGYLLVGLAVGRSDLASRAVQTTLLWLGSAMAIVAYTVGELLAPVDPKAFAYPGVPAMEGAKTAGGRVLAEWLSPRGHSASIVDMLGSIGVSIAVIGLCSLLFTERRGVVARIVARPFAAVGSMPLSIYALHIVVLALLLARPEGLDYGAKTVWGFVLGSTVFALLWSRFIGRGPLEAGLSRLTSGVGRRPVPSAPPAAEPAEPEEPAGP
ncbi:DUF418 domain-containing protein [Curtobacterium sp. Leaf261]|uniref:DUF418 domain-containing protein n=1 Tax=Curtobacterium sp. Leaf261 TaxID=1736311 RepID=UPI0006F9D0D5|nr:heparan-alpha-glucosaminide N-acetyltransferase domain-containing protein [Curtobacterium sp. Leaf261]KQO62340.1 hypothetical protein ASF23_11155 [Curtobacterium sp. Leaf261]